MDSGKEINWLWVIPIALLLPAYHLFVFLLQNGRITHMLLASTVFIPAGMLEGVALIGWLRQVRSEQQRRNTLIGFLIGFMLAYFGSLLFPLVMPSWVGATIGGAGPWLLCTWLGFRRAVPEPPARD
jgi:hypothetical protein